MNFFDMFKSAPTAAAATDPNATVVQPAALSATAPATVDGKIPEGTPTNPLDEYKKMFDNSVKSSDIEAPSFKIDPAVLGKVSDTMDFTKGIDPELMTKALSGDAKSLLDVMQSVGRNTYKASLEHNTSLTDAHLSNRAAFERQSVDKGVKQQLTANALSTAPNYDHPVVKAELNRVANQFAQANPDASPTQIATAAQKYIADLQGALNPTKSPEQTQAESGEVDWSKYISR